MAFSEQHKANLSVALKAAWSTKRASSRIVLGERRIIRGKLRQRVKCSKGWTFWKLVPLPKPEIDFASLTRAQRSRLRKRGVKIPIQSPGVRVGFKRSLPTRLRQSISAKKYLFDVRSVAKEQKERIRKSLIYRHWRQCVFVRDGFECQSCGNKSRPGNPVVLEAHHVKSYAAFPSLRFEVSNGLTLGAREHQE